MRIPLLKLPVLILILCMAWTLACSQSADDQPDKIDDSMVVQLLVTEDDMFGYDLEEQAGRVFLSDSRGPVGSPVEVVVLIDEIERFDENEIDLAIVLSNPDAIKLEKYEFTATFDEERAEFKIIMPQVVTVPTLLDFDITIMVTNDETGDFFEAISFFQFYISSGTPAT